MPMIRALRSQGREVIVLAPRDEYTNRILAEGIPWREIRLNAKGRNPFQEILTTIAFLRAYREIRPDVVLHYTIKPNLYGSLAARVLRIPAIDNVTGLGAVFEQRGALQFAVRFLYKAAFARAERVFFQNPDDRDVFIRGGLVRKARAGLLPGSGVDLSRFAPGPRGFGAFAFLFIGRLLKAKGVEDLIRAARIVQTERPGTRIVLLGKRDDGDPGAADPRLLDEAAEKGTIRDRRPCR